MPVSLNTPGLDHHTPPNTTVATRRKLKRTNQMVEDALIELHTARGVTLKQIYSFIMSTYDLNTLTNMRVTLIKKYLFALRASDELVNTKGKGLSGHFKLVDKNKFIQKLNANIKAARENLNATRRLVRKAKTEAAGVKPKGVKKNKSEQTTLKTKIVKRNIKKANPNIKQIAPVITKHISPTVLENNNTSMFDTPMVATQVHASTPFISTTLVPRAPEVNRKLHRKRVSESKIFGTPRSSLSGKKRKLQKRPE